jgi:hypothetical protein
MNKVCTRTSTSGEFELFSAGYRDLGNRVGNPVGAWEVAVAEGWFYMIMNKVWTRTSRSGEFELFLVRTQGFGLLCPGF